MSVNINLKDKIWEGVNRLNVPLEGGNRQVFSLGGGEPTLQTKTATYTPTTSQQTDTIRPDTGYDGLSAVDIIVNAMQSGAEMPTFTLSGIQEGSTVTCDKTYAECLAFYNNGMKVAVAVTTSYGKLPVLVYEVGSDYVKYIAYFQDGSPLGDITLTASSVSYTATSVIEKTPNKPVARKSTVTDHAMKVNVAVTNYKGFYPSGLVAGDPIYVSASEVVSGSETKTQNGTYDVTNLAELVVNVPTSGATLQTTSKSYTPSETAQSETIGPDSGYDGLSSVDISVGAISSTYVGSGITRRDDDDMSGVVDDPYYVVSAPSGYYPNSAEYTLPLMTLPSTAESTHSGTRKANILPSTSQRYLTIPSGYNPTTQYYQLIGADIAPLNVTQNGTYDPATYDVFGFGSITVDVQGGGASNFVEGTFTTGASAGYTSISIPYTGSGYPIMCVVVIDGGAYHSGTSWYTSTQRYAIGQWTMTKSNMTAAPSYATSGANNQGVTTWVFKNSTSSSTSYSRSSAMNTNVFTSNNPSNSGANTIKLKANNTLSYYVNTSSYGLHPNMTYRYFIVYSE